MTIYQHNVKLGKFIQDKIYQHGWPLSRFAEEYGNPPVASTLYQIVRARQRRVGTALLKNIAEGLSDLTKEKITVDMLVDMIEEDTSPVVSIKEERIKLEPSVLLWHFRRLNAAERMKIWSEIFKLAARDIDGISDVSTESFPVGRSPKIEILIGLINGLADRAKIDSIGELADWLINRTAAVSKEREILVEGLYAITALKELPYQDEEAFQTIGFLAQALDFPDDQELLEYCGLESRISGNTGNIGISVTTTEESDFPSPSGT